jgi:hypothetical protein
MKEATMPDNFSTSEQNENTQPSKVITRRTFLRVVGITSAGVLFAACDVIPQNPDLPIANEAVTSPYPAAADETISDELTRFMQISMVLTGFNNLSPQLAEAYMNSIANADNDATLEDLYNSLDADAPVTLDQMREAGVFDDAALGGLISSIVKHWYTGTYQDGENTVVATYTDALAWRALDFTKPHTICGTPHFWQTNPYQQP